MLPGYNAASIVSHLGGVPRLPISLALPFPELVAHWDPPPGTKSCSCKGRQRQWRQSLISVVVSCSFFDGDPHALLLSSRLMDMQPKEPARSWMSVIAAALLKRRC